MRRIDTDKFYLIIISDNHHAWYIDDLIGIRIGNWKGSQWLVQLHDKQGCSICRNTVNNSGMMEFHPLSDQFLENSEYIHNPLLVRSNKPETGEHDFNQK